MSPLFSPVNVSGTALSQLLRSIGKPLPQDLETNGSLVKKPIHPIQKQTRNPALGKILGNEKPIPKEKLTVSHHYTNSKAKELSRWETFTKYSGSDSRTSEPTSLKGIWNFFLGESKGTDFLSVHKRERKENLEMVVEPNEKGCTLYVFWKAEGFGPLGILFYYEPENQNPVNIEFVSHGMENDETQSVSPDLKQKLQDLIRDFPQIGSISFEEWNQSSFNGDYR
ncbi:hypothetical protein [Leptospira paudalimensis]|uniref:Uncharacterized protein n=1 Tax=Leptospira paudalimensis TaxID=2950024 RepID=A0ABT3M6X3_9LEPT|nr:hypothetical protein [Leptospira paudalimensis]MCW7504134.1 hypothetical protein [Leptospira paudalimensis]